MRIRPCQYDGIGCINAKGRAIRDVCAGEAAGARTGDAVESIIALHRIEHADIRDACNRAPALETSTPIERTRKVLHRLAHQCAAPEHIHDTLAVGAHGTALPPR